MVLKLLALNVKGLNSPYKHRALWKGAIGQQCDILFVQESHFSSSNTPRYTSRCFLHTFQANLVAIRDTIAFKLLASSLDEGGRFVILAAEFKGTIYTLLVLHTPNMCQLYTENIGQSTCNGAIDIMW